MADSSGYQRLEDAHPSNDLGYGHLGTATYSEESHEWTFLRRTDTTSAGTPVCLVDASTGTGFPFRLTDEEPKIVVESQSGSDEDGGKERLLSANSSEILRNIPELGFIAAKERENGQSTPPANTTLIMEPNQSQRLDFGHAAWLNEKDKSGGHAYAPIAAFAVGRNAKNMKIVRIGRGTAVLRTDDDQPSKSKVPTITNQDEAWWVGTGEPIQQICFAATSGYQSSWMAIRQKSGTTILHPLLHRRPVPARYASEISQCEKYPASCLDANPALSLPISRTGGYPHADVAFNPQNHLVLAIIDESGNWSLWEIRGRTASTGSAHVGDFRIYLQASGSHILVRPQHTPIDPYSPYDRWHRIHWLATTGYDSESLLVFGRHTSALYNKQGNLLHEINVRLGLPRAGQVILDTKSSTRHRGHYFVLTSTRLLHLSTSGEQVISPKPRSQLQVIWSWSHFRSRTDVTLRLVLVEHASSLTVLIYSQQNALVIAFTAKILHHSSSTSLSVTDPIFLHLPSIIKSEKVSSFLTMNFHEIQSERWVPWNHAEQPQLYKLFVQDSDLQITELLYQYSGINLFPLATTPNTILPLPGSRALKARSSKYATAFEMEDFIVADDLNDAQDQLSLDDIHEESDFTRTENASSLQGSMIDFREVYEILIADSEEHEQEDIVDKLQLLDFKETAVALDSNLHLLCEHLPQNFEVKDIEEASSALDSLLTSISGQTNPNMQVFTAKQWHTQAAATLLDHYNSMVSIWVTPLSLEIPNRVRVNKERLIRKVATDLTLASTSVRKVIEGIEDNTESTRGPLGQAHDFLASSSPPQTSPYLPQELPEDTACRRLRFYTTIAKPVPSTSITNPVMSSILAHLPQDISGPYGDPSNYSYRAIESQLAAARRDETFSRLDPRFRRRLEREAELGRRRLEAQKILSQQAAEQKQIPSIVVEDRGKQMTQLPFREVQSSQIAGPVGMGEGIEVHSPVGGVSMTQPERGLFGDSRRGGVKPEKGKAREGRRRPGF